MSKDGRHLPSLHFPEATPSLRAPAAWTSGRDTDTKRESQSHRRTNLRTSEVTDVGLRGTSGKTALLKKVQLFEGLSDRQLQQIARLADEIDAPAGKILARAGDTGREMFVIVDGQATVTTSQRRTLQLGTGDFFGEMSLLDGGPRSATVEAATPMHLLVIGQREFFELLAEAPLISKCIMRTLSQRLRKSDAAFSMCT